MDFITGLFIAAAVMRVCRGGPHMQEAARALRLFGIPCRSWTPGPDGWRLVVDTFTPDEDFN